MNKHTKSNKTNTILKVLSTIVGGSGLVLAGVVGTMMITSPDKESISNFHNTAASSSVVQSSSSTEESSKVQLQSSDVTTHQGEETTSSSTTESNDSHTYAQEPVHGTYQVLRTGADYIVWGTPEGICYVQPTTRQTLNQRSVHDMEQILFALGVRDVGDIDSSKLNDMATGLSVDVTKPFKPSAGPVYIYTNNTPAAYTLAN